MPNRPLLLGHRGARGEKSIPENTIASFDRALAQGCDGFEFDVRLSADGQAVICHNARWRGLFIAKCSFQELGLPLLSEILQRYAATAFLDIELKVPGLETIALNLISVRRPSRFVISSFLPEVLQRLHALDSSIPLGLICETRAQVRLWPTLPIDYAILHHKIAKPAVLAALRSAGKKVFVWTVNSANDLVRFADGGVDGIISDYPERMVGAAGHRP
jgi:glycerophosphoryl diester phosphodiesterase